MIVSKKDIETIRKMFSEFGDFFKGRVDLTPGYERDKELYLWNIGFFYDNPHLLFPIGFDEVRYICGKDKFMAFLGQPGINPDWLMTEDYALFRWRKDGAWYFLHESPFMGGEFRLHRVGDVRQGLWIPADDVLRSLEVAMKHPSALECAVISPLLWTPTSQLREKLYLQESTVALLAALRENRCSLSDLTWQQLEDIVAEVLRARGLEVHRVVERPQGGKDLIVRGELLPGEITYMAVEIKHRPIVGVSDIRAALNASEEFPALLFVTSGRFTGGVVRERMKAANQLRLILKDGEALGDMIRSYGIAGHRTT
jgi:hypothetical protein